MQHCECDTPDFIDKNRQRGVGKTYRYVINIQNIIYAVNLVQRILTSRENVTSFNLFSSINYQSTYIYQFNDIKNSFYMVLKAMTLKSISNNFAKIRRNPNRPVVPLRGQKEVTG